MSGFTLLKSMEPEEIKRFLEQTIAELRKQEGSAKNETNIDLAQRLLAQIESNPVVDAMKLMELLGLTSAKDEAPTRRHIGFVTPEDANSESLPPKTGRRGRMGFI